jgi:hypothetical protein
MNDLIHNIIPTHLRRRRASLLRRAATAAATATVAAIFALATLPLHAVVVWQDDFSGHIVGNAPTQIGKDGKNIWDRASNNASAIAASGDPTHGNILRINDTKDAGDGNAPLSMARYYHMDDFDTRTSAQSVIKLEFDMRVDSFASANSGNPGVQVSLYDGANNASCFIFGFSTIADGGKTYNALYAATTRSPDVNTSSAIGRIGVGTWAEGFNFGEYDPETATNNNTGGFLHFEVTYIDQSDSITLTVTNGTQSIATTITGFTPFTLLGGALLPGRAENTLSLRLTSSAAAISDVSYDNFVLSVDAPAIPEPRDVALLGSCGALGLALLARVHRQRQQSHN